MTYQHAFFVIYQFKTNIFQVRIDLLPQFTWPKEGERSFSPDRRIYVSTYPTMLNIIRNEEQNVSPHFFDLIVVDESHRSIYNTYGEILDYFNTIVLGLTATPTDVIDHNTFKLFECEDGIPTFAYSYDEAVNNIPPYLCNFQVMKIKTKFQEDGINKRTVSLEDQKNLILEGKDICSRPRAASTEVFLASTTASGLPSLPNKT